MKSKDKSKPKSYTHFKSKFKKRDLDVKKMIETNYLSALM